MVRDLAARPKSLDLDIERGAYRKPLQKAGLLLAVKGEKISHNAREGVAFGRGLDRSQAVKGTYLGVAGPQKSRASCPRASSLLGSGRFQRSLKASAVALPPRERLLGTACPRRSLTLV